MFESEPMFGMLLPKNCEYLREFIFNVRVPKYIYIHITAHDDLFENNDD